MSSSRKTSSDSGEPARAASANSGADRPELLAPVGDRESALAALQYGADAVYVGLERFSARSGAGVPAAAMADIVGYAHALAPRRRVYATVNTVVLEQELPTLVAQVGLLSDLGVDAVIVQDLGVAWLVRRHFPRLALHASTQMAVHNLAGARTLGRLGFQRVIPARELTLAEIRGLARESGLEIEVFIHGALCYSYSGLCLMSSHLRHRSGNRGACAYPCRERYEPVAAGAGGGFLFSMKDLALPDRIAELRRAGVHSFKIEGRKKSALYVAAVSRFYRGLLDGTLAPAEQAVCEDELKSIFSRPWTTLFMDSAARRDTVDPHWVGHRGVPAGVAESCVRQPGRLPVLRFRARRAIERHDGLQVELVGGGKPFGFAVLSLQQVAGDGRCRPVYEAPAGALLDVELPEGAPEIPRGAVLHCSSSQAVKRRYPVAPVKPGLHRVRQGVAVAVRIEERRVCAHARAGGIEADVAVEAAEPWGQTRDPGAMGAAVQAAFAKLGQTDLQLESVEVLNPDGRFVPVSRLNELRRQMAEAVTAALAAAAARRVRDVMDELSAWRPPATDPAPADPLWAVKVDRAGDLDRFEPADLAACAEIVVAVDGEPLATLRPALAALAGRVGRDRIRLALPAVTRDWEAAALREAVTALKDDGWRRWEVNNLSGWTVLGMDSDRGGDALDVQSGWPLYVLNPAAARQVLEAGAGSVVLSPEDGVENMAALLARLGPRATVIVYQDTPLMVSESCAAATAAGRCPGRDACRAGIQTWQGESGAAVRAVPRGCRTVVIGTRPYCLASFLGELRAAGARRLRAEFVNRPYEPDEVRDLWRRLRSGRPPAHWHSGNFRHGLARGGEATAVPESGELSGERGGDAVDA